MPQEPGPPGCPQLSQGLGIADAADAALAVVANTESCFSRCVDAQPGHCGMVSERTSASNWCPQSLHSYS
jgi:hypothetical protein